MQSTKQSRSYEDLLAANFDRCLAEQRARRAAYEQAPISPYGWNQDTHSYETTLDDQIDMQAEQVLEQHDFVAHCQEDLEF